MILFLVGPYGFDLGLEPSGLSLGLEPSALGFESCGLGLGLEPFWCSLDKKPGFNYNASISTSCSMIPAHCC